MSLIRELKTTKYMSSTNSPDVLLKLHLLLIKAHIFMSVEMAKRWLAKFITPFWILLSPIKIFPLRKPKNSSLNFNDQKYTNRTFGNFSLFFLFSLSLSLSLSIYLFLSFIFHKL